MPSYIELDKQGSFPSSSNAGKVILGVNTSGQVITTNSSGQTSPVGGGGTGLYIPKPIPYSISMNLPAHAYNDPISILGDGSGLPGARTNTWSTEALKLTYDSTDDTFLNHNPRYFLFVYEKLHKLGKASGNFPNNRINNNKYGKYFSHPASFSGSYVDDGMGGWDPNFTNVAAYTNFSGNLQSTIYFGSGATPKYTSSFSSFTTEWTVATGSGQPTTLNGFNPLRFYWSIITGSGDQYRGREFFPMKITGSYDEINFGNEVSVTTKKGFKKQIVPKSTPVETFTKPRVDLYIKFAIVVDDPNNAGRYLIGPMSDTIKIFPKEGYFLDDVDTNETLKYYYAWSWKLQ